MFGFKKRKKMKIFYHEDMYLQIEILPFENKQFCLNQVKSIVGFSEEHKDGIGYTDVYTREAEEYKLVEKQISFLTVKNILGRHLNYYNEVYTGYGSSCKVKCSNTVGFGFESIQILINFKEDIVENIWINGFTRNKEEVNYFAEALIELGNVFNLVICDWEACSIVELTDHKRVREYAGTYYLSK